MMIPSILNKIILKKQEALDQLIYEVSRDPLHPLCSIINKKSDRVPIEYNDAFSKALSSSSSIAVIAEIKRQSPSAGVISQIIDPERLASTYAKGGASAISVLTDADGFGGSLQDLERVSKSVVVPVLRKDFIIHPLQIAEAKLAGAKAVLLIAAIFHQNLERFKTLIHETARMGLEALVEIHTEEELALSIEAGAKILGVNQRNLNTFSMHPELFESLAKHIPSHMIRVAESGIRNADDAKRVQDLGYHALLVGEALVRSPYPDLLIQKLKGVS